MRHLLSTADLTRADALAVLDTAEEMAAVNDREVKKLPALRGRTVVMSFQPATVAEAYFGRNASGQEVVTDSAWTRFLDEVVTPAFPDGLTVLAERVE